MLSHILYCLAILALGACSGDSSGGEGGSKPKKDVRYVWPDEGTTAPPVHIQGATGFIGPYATSLVAESCAILGGCFDEVAVSECMATVREYWRHRDQGDAGRILQNAPLMWAPAPLSLATQLECVSAARDCDTVINCIASAESCGGCFGDSVVACPEEGAPLGFKIDCSEVSLQCVETTEGFSASCGAGTCNTLGNTCAGNLRSACELGVAKEYDCESANLQCESDGSEDAWCQGQSGPCSPDSDIAICVGALTRNCIGGGWREEDCAFLGDVGSHRCTVTQEETPRALCIFDAGCDPGSFVPTCEDGNLELCPSGRPITIDCVGLGLGGCTLTPNAGCQGFGEP